MRKAELGHPSRHRRAARGSDYESTEREMDKGERPNDGRSVNTPAPLLVGQQLRLKKI